MIVVSSEKTKGTRFPSVPVDQSPPSARLGTQRNCRGVRIGNGNETHTLGLSPLRTLGRSRKSKPPGHNRPKIRYDATQAVSALKRGTHELSAWITKEVRSQGRTNLCCVTVSPIRTEDGSSTV